jgi:hypothetical protein
VRPLLKLVPADRPLNADEVNSAVDLITSHYRWPDMNLDSRAFREAALALQTPQLRDILEIVYRAILARDGKVRWGDKTPGYIEIVPTLLQMFPDALFVHCLRDGRDVANSFQRRRWDGRYLHENTNEWRWAMALNERWINSGFASRILQLRYEDLVLNTEPTVRWVCTFLGEHFEQQMLSWHQNADRLVPSREADIHARLKNAPAPEDAYRWKRDMPPRKLFICEAFMRQPLARQGYELKFAHPLWLPILIVVRLYCTHLLPLQGLVARRLQRLRSFGQRKPAPPALPSDTRGQRQ